MGYTTNDNMVRVDFFRDTGKWYTTEAVRYDFDIKDGGYESFVRSVLKHLAKTEFFPNQGKYQLGGMWAVCTDEKMTFPMMIKVPST